eukprot:9498471-Pyramimonas_sp.AAC.1
MFRVSAASPDPVLSWATAAAVRSQLTGAVAQLQGQPEKSSSALRSWSIQERLRRGIRRSSSSTGSDPEWREAQGGGAGGEVVFRVEPGSGRDE